jgi:hypothetical protein
MHTRDGGQVIRGNSGVVREVRPREGVIVRHPPEGVRHVEVVRSGSTVVATSRTYGYVQRPVVVGHDSFVQRTYYRGGVTYVNVYRPYHYGVVDLHVYTPVRYYRPAYYSWIYSPWSRPVVYTSWGWVGTPWFRFYGGYFAPYPTYATPMMWVTDYLIASTLQQGYQERLAAGMNSSYAPSPQPGLTPEVKDAIANEVRYQLDAERMGAGAPDGASGVAQAPPLFSGRGPHVLLASSPVTAFAGGGECGLTEGDVVALLQPPPTNSPVADVEVRASKPRDCPAGAVVSVGLQDLQEMQNRMHENVDRSLGEMQARQGTGGMPPMPRDAAAQPVAASFASQITPDPNVTTDLNQATQDAFQSEQTVLNQAGTDNQPGAPGGAPNVAPPATISVGQTVEEVVAVQGQPQTVANGANGKMLYVYPGIKVVFVDGRVVDVQ